MKKGNIKKWLKDRTEMLCRSIVLCILLNLLQGMSALSLIDYAKQGNLEKVKEAINRSENINTQDFYGNTALIRAAKKGHIAIVKYLCQQTTKINLNLQNKGGNTALIWAAKKGHIAIVKYLCQQTTKINLNLQDKDGNTALIWAAEKGHIEIVKYLCQQDNIDITIKNNKNETALILIASMKDDQIDLVMSLCQKVNKPAEYINWQDDYGYTALTVANYDNNNNTRDYLIKHENIDKNINFISAAVTQQLKLVKLLLKEYANDDDFDINAIDKYGYTALTIAAYNKRQYSKKYLLQHKKTNKNITLISAARTDQLELVKLLLTTYKNEININAIDKDKNTALIWAARKGYIDIVKYLCDQPGIDIKAQDEYGDTAVTWAAYNGRIEIVKFLCEEKGIDINTKGEGGKTVLICAAMNGNMKIVKYLCDQPNIDIEATDNNGDAAITWAAKKGHTAIVQYLCGQGKIDIIIKNNKNETALIWVACMKNDQVNLVRSLCEKNNTPEYINWQDDDGYTALTVAYNKENENVKNYLLNHEKSDKNITFISAARTGQLDLVKELLTKYANDADFDINAKDKDGNTALIWAAKKGHTAIVQYLCGQGKIDITIKNNKNETALIWVACMKNDQVNLVRSLCEKNNTPEYINWQDDDGYTALICAAMNGNMKIVKYLCDQPNIDIEATDNNGDAAITWAAKKGHTAIVQYLCGQGKIDIIIKNNKNETALIWVACMKNDQVNLVRSLCEKNNTPEYINWQDDDGYTALTVAYNKENENVKNYLLNHEKSDKNITFISAARTGQLDLVKELLTKYANDADFDINAKDKDDNTALIWAAKKGHTAIVQYLCGQGKIDITIKNNKNETALIWVACMKNDQVNLVRSLCEKNNTPEYINWQDDDGYTALICAAMNGNMKIVKYLCDQPNIDIEATDNNDDAAITWAAKNGHTEIVKFLKEKGIDINTKGQDGKTVLIWAGIKGYVDIIDYLRNLPEIDPNLQDDKGDTAFSWTAYNGHEKCIDSLRKYSDIDPKIANYAGDTPTHRAAKGAKISKTKDYRSTYKKLIDAGIDTQQENNKGEKAIDLVEDNELKTILREYVPKKTDSTDIDNNDSTDNSDKSDSDNINADRTPEEKSYTGTVVFIALLLTTGSLIAATLFFWPKNDTKSEKDAVYGAKHNSKNKNEKPKKNSNPRAIQVA